MRLHSAIRNVLLWSLHKERGDRLGVQGISSCFGGRAKTAMHKHTAEFVPLAHFFFFLCVCVPAAVASLLSTRALIACGGSTCPTAPARGLPLPSEGRGGRGERAAPVRQPDELVRQVLAPRALGGGVPPARYAVNHCSLPPAPLTDNLARMLQKFNSITPGRIDGHPWYQKGESPSFEYDAPPGGPGTPMLTWCLGSLYIFSLTPSQAE